MEAAVRKDIDQIIEDVLRPPPSRGRRNSSIQVAYVRDINESDVQALWAIPAGGLETVQPLVKLRHHHHYLARLLAEGRENVECSLLTGLEPATISRIKVDPAMVELIEYYKAQVDEVFVNVHERLASLGLNSAAELQERLDTDPERFSNRELMELAALGFDRSGNGPSSKVEHDHSSLITGTVLEKLKDELAKRSRSQIRTLTQSGIGPQGGLVIEHAALAETSPSQGREGAGSDVREEGGK